MVGARVVRAALLYAAGGVRWCPARRSSWRQGVYFLNVEAQTHPSIEFYGFATGRTTRVAAVGKELFGGSRGLTATPDGRRILYARNDQTESDIMPVENFS